MRTMLLAIMMLSFSVSLAPAAEETQEFRDVTPEEMLLQSAWEGAEESVRILLDRGVNVNPYCPQRPPKIEKICSPLIYASQKAHLDIMKLLLGVGASVNTREAHGDAPLHHAMRSGSDEAVKLLVSFGADMNLRNNAGITPFMMACRDGRMDIVKLFISKGAELDAADASGRTARDYAAEAGRDDMVAFLDDYRRKFIGDIE